MCAFPNEEKCSKNERTNETQTSAKHAKAHVMVADAIAIDQNETKCFHFENN